jgi:SAM-dependent methyltransferase
MKPNALAIYVCPACKGTLELTREQQDGGEVLEGRLTCSACRAVYPITRGVPRFVGSGAYASTFGQQWNWFRHVQLDSYNHTDRSRRTLTETTGWDAAAFNGQLVLDAGVGAGRFAECVAAQGGRVFGVDLTHAVDAAFESIGRRDGVNLAQADIFALPFRDATFDLAYSIGVLHHTPDPERAFDRVAACVKPAGQLAVYLYARYGINRHLPDLIRKVTTRLPTRLMLLLSAAAVPVYFIQKIPVIGTAMRVVLPVSDIPDWRWRWLDTFDWFTPKYQFKYLYPEIFRWFDRNGFRDIAIFDGPIRMRGVKAERAQTDESDYLRRVVAS